MISWLDENKEWLFSGAGIAILMWSSKFMKLVFSNRKSQSILGEWTGLLKQHNGINNKEVTFSISFEIYKRYGMLKARGIIWLEESHEKSEERIIARTRIISTPFVKGQLFNFEYKILNNSVVQFGNVLTRLNAYGNKLQGHFIGYGATTEQVVYGNVNLNKKIK